MCLIFFIIIHIKERNYQNVQRRGSTKIFNEQKEFMDSRVNAGIGTNRKGFARIDVTDSDRNPIKGLSFKAVGTRKAWRGF